MNRRTPWGLAVLWPLLTASAHAEEQATRPVLKTNRWQENWSVLQDPVLRTQPLDNLKCIPLSSANPLTYLSLGASLRERFEMNDASGFGVRDVKRDRYLIQRFEIHADLHLDENWRVFTQLEDARAYDKTTVGGADQNRVDLRLAFAEYVNTFSSGTFKGRIGRQDFAFDLQRFISSRDGPNVRQSFDALWADWETTHWRFIAIASQPVQYQDERHFDDRSNSDARFHLLRVERLVGGSNELSAYYGVYERSAAHYLDADGEETRQLFDARLLSLIHI